MALFDSAITAQLQAGSIWALPPALANIAIMFDRMQRPEISATLYGTVKKDSRMAMYHTVPAVVEHLRIVLGESRFDGLVAAGEAMDLAQAVRYARAQMNVLRSELAPES